VAAQRAAQSRRRSLPSKSSNVSIPAQKALFAMQQILPGFRAFPASTYSLQAAPAKALQANRIKLHASVKARCGALLRAGRGIYVDTNSYPKAWLSATPTSPPSRSSPIGSMVNRTTQSDPGEVVTLFPNDALIAREAVAPQHLRAALPAAEQRQAALRRRQRSRRQHCRGRTGPRPGRHARSLPSWSPG
jgi:hypothetical protein